MSFRQSPRAGPIAAILLALVALYRVSLGHLLGGRCRFYPSCSAYAQQALRAHGAFHGLRFISGRLLRCHPWHPGGLDPIPLAKRGFYGSSL